MIDNRLKKERFRKDVMEKGEKIKRVKNGDRNSGKSTEKSGDKSRGKDFENKRGERGDGNRKKSVEKSWEKSAFKDSDRGEEKKWEKSGDKGRGKSAENKWEKGGDKNKGKNLEKKWREQGDRSKANSKEKVTEGNKDNFRDSSKYGGKEQKKDYKNKDRSYGKGGYERKNSICPVFQKCGGCQLLDMPYEKQLEQKQKQLADLLKPYCHIEPIIGMKNPYYYRNKVHAVFDFEKGNPISGVYEANSHRVVPVEKCMIEDQKSDEIIGTIRGMLKSFKIRTYNEDTGYGLLRHVLVRRGFATGEIMVVLVTASPVFPSKNNFVKALREKHPEITTVIQNVNNRDTSMILGDKEHVLYGKGFIEDVLCGYRFRISSKSFYQINPVQTEVLYKKAIEAAGLTGNERVIDAYCGIGTIGIVASSFAKEVIGVELNRDAVRDAVENAKINKVKNARFFCNDAGKFMVNMAENGEHVDLVFMDPPRSGSTEEFIESVAKLKPEKVVYVSCGPETLARDLEYFRKMGYEARKGWGVDLFPNTGHVESVILLHRKNI